MANLDFKITGLEQVTNNLRQLPVKLQRKYLRNATRKAMNIVRDDAKQAAPEDTGFVKKSIVTRINTSEGRRIGGVVAEVGIRGGSRKYKNNAKNRKLGRAGKRYLHGGNAYYWRFREFGAYNVKAKRFIQAQPFMRPALSKNINNVTQIMVNELTAAIRRELY